jgi:hypothetical protein
MDPSYLTGQAACPHFSPRFEKGQAIKNKLP